MSSFQRKPSGFQLQPKANGGMQFGTALIKLSIEVDGVGNMRMNATGPGRPLAPIEILDTMATALKMQTNWIMNQSNMIIDPNRAPNVGEGEADKNADITETEKENDNGNRGNPSGSGSN